MISLGWRNVEAAQLRTVEGGFKSRKKCVCQSSFQQYDKYLVSEVFTKFKAILIRFGQFIVGELQSFTPYAQKDLRCVIDDAYSTVIDV